MKRAAWALLGAALLLATIGCSPEASRTRGGGPGADVGNYSPSLPQPSTPPALPGG
ncbi:MAG TPA: hypothetical protein VGQ62_10385 [Chloroflexota bacterium]|nr:hypothetical protein [Chloroflexota bacterium]